MPLREEAFVKATLTERPALTIVVAARAKLGTAEPLLVAPAMAVRLLVTDAPAVVALRQAGIEVACVPADE